MTDEEIKEFVQVAILTACDTEIAKFDKEIPIVESEEGEIGFKLNFRSQLTRTEVIYSPQPYLEMIAKNLLVDVLSETDLKHKLGAVEDIAVLIIRMMVTELGSTVNFIPYLAQELYLKYFNKLAFYSNDSFFRKSESQQRSDIKEILEFSRNKQITRIVNFTREVSELFTAPQYLFCDVYETQAKIWKEAANCYKENIKYKNPFGAVKSNFPELPEDLIQELGSLDKETSRPSTIALKHTARMLNIETTDRLSRYLTESRKLRKNISDQQAQEAADKYIGSINHLTSIVELMNQEITAKNENENGSKM